MYPSGFYKDSATFLYSQPESEKYGTFALSVHLQGHSLQLQPIYGRGIGLGKSLSMASTTRSYRLVDPCSYWVPICWAKSNKN